MIWLFYVVLLIILIILEFNTDISSKHPYLGRLKFILLLVALFSGALQVGVLFAIAVLLSYQLISPFISIYYFVSDLIIKPNYSIVFESESKDVEQEIEYHRIFKRYCNKEIKKIESLRIFAVLLSLLIAALAISFFIAMYNVFSFLGSITSYIAVIVIFLSVRRIFNIDVNENNIIVRFLTDYLLNSNDSIESYKQSIYDSEILLERRIRYLNWKFEQDNNNVKVSDNTTPLCYKPNEPLD